MVEAELNFSSFCCVGFSSFVAWEVRVPAPIGRQGSCLRRGPKTSPTSWVDRFGRHGSVYRERSRAHRPPKRYRRSHVRAIQRTQVRVVASYVGALVGDVSKQIADEFKLDATLKVLRSPNCDRFRRESHRPDPTTQPAPPWMASPRKSPPLSAEGSLSRISRPALGDVNRKGARWRTLGP